MQARKAALSLGAAAVILGGTISAALLGVGATMGFPKTDFTSPANTGTAFQAASRQLTVSATPVSTNFGVGTPVAVTAPRQLAIALLVPDNAGLTVASVAGNDLELSGQIDEDGNGTVDHSGVLLTGEILAMGSLAIPGPTPDSLDLRFRVTGGSLAPQYNGKDIGVVVGMENSTFNGQFINSFTGGAKGFLGPIPCAGRIGDFVWHDLNSDGIQDPGEPGINGVQVTLNGTDAFGNPVTRTTTTGIGPMNQSGYYQFTALCGGEYVVTADTPSGFDPTTSLAGPDRAIDSNGSPTTVVLTGLSDQTIDFGFRTECTGAVGDFVWHDVNRNGLQDAGEPGLDGITVTLMNPVTLAVIATTTTGPNGFYKFTGLCAGDYKIQVNESELPAGFTPTVTTVPPDTTIDSNPNPFIVTLPADNTEDFTIDFGYVAPCTGNLGDFVWYDKNQNGLQEPGELGIDGVTVKLMDTSDAVLSTTTTGPNGFYQFTGLCARTYRVAVDESTVPPGFTPTLVTAGSDTAIDSNPNPFDVTLPLDTSSDITIDFGYIAPCTGQIGDFVWHDLDFDGIQDAGEPAIPGVVVNLRGADNTILHTDTTDASGLYLFEGLCPGDYKVEVVPPAGAIGSPSLQGGNITLDSNPNPTPVTLLFDDSVDLTNDFGFYYPPASLGDFVWEDLNRDGQQDSGEPGIDGVTVRLYECDGTVPLQTTVTAEGGAYLFEGLSKGVCYQVEFVKPAGYERTLPNAGADDADSDASLTTGRTGSYQLEWGEYNPTVDAGLYRPAKLGDYVWIDTNANGIQDPSETQGVVGATAALYVCAGNTVGSPAAVPAQTIGANGLYLFANLAPGAYAVKFTLPAGYTFTSQGAGLDDARDSDASPATGFSACVTLQSGETNLTVDAGAVVPSVVCVPSVLSFTGSSYASGAYGNIREFSYGGVQVRVSAFSRLKTSASWETAYLGAYSLGLGVTDRSEGSGANDSHTVDNYGRNNYVLFEFSTPVVVTQAFLDYVGADSDINVWIGTFAAPYSNHLTLSDTVLGNFGLSQTSDTTSANSRWAPFNGGEVSGNALVIAARTDQTNDSFKLRKLEVCVPQQPTAAIGDFVWHDVNGNGIQDAAEPGIDGAKVYLLDATSTIIATRTTGDNPNAAGTQQGYYEFTGLTPGATYRVSFAMPAGFDTASPRELGGNPAADSDGSVSDPVVLAAGEFNRTIDAGFYKPTPVCVATTLTLTGATATSGTAGNVRTFFFSGLTVKVSAFSRTKSTAAWAKGYLGAYSYGLGVTDTSEGTGGNNSHLVDNYDRNNYVLFEFSSPVVVDKVYLDYVQGDSDISAWVGNNPLGNDPFTNHLNLSDWTLSQFDPRESNVTTSTTARWADINASSAAGNALVIATPLDQSNDGFKLRKLVVCK